MSNDDFNSKVGKSALDGLLNIKKPEPVAAPAYESSVYDRYPVGREDGFSGYDSGLYGRNNTKFEPSYKSDVTTREPAWLKGKTRLASKGDVSGQVRFEPDGKFAIVGENALRNIRVAVRTKILDELRVRGVHVKLGEDYAIDDFINHLLVAGSCQVKKKQGGGFLTIKSDDWFGDELDFDGEL